MKQFTHPELPFPIVNSFKKMSAYHQKSVTLFGCLATVSVSKSFFGAVTVEFEFDDATQSTVDTLRDTVLSLFGEPTHVGGSRFFFQKAGVVLSHGIIEKYYNSINHIFTVSFARLPALVWPFWRYQLYLYTLQAEWEPFSLVMKSLHAPDFANRRLSIIL
ncbi:MAG: hypothetical protein IKC63_07820 [Clostridia bacterium]|nr:hypothetical protein [Clostridia bacterium]